MHSFVVEDDVKVPANLTPGEWVVGFRWDCEQTSVSADSLSAYVSESCPAVGSSNASPNLRTLQQIWQSCADITIV